MKIVKVVFLSGAAIGTLLAASCSSPQGVLPAAAAGFLLPHHRQVSRVAGAAT